MKAAPPWRSWSGTRRDGSAALPLHFLRQRPWLPYAAVRGEVPALRRGGEGGDGERRSGRIGSVMDEGWAYEVVRNGRIREKEFARHIPQIREAVNRHGQAFVGEYLIQRTREGLHLADALTEMADASP